MSMNRIVGISDRRQLPRVGKIRLGEKKVAGSGKEYPTEVAWFVTKPEDFASPVHFERFRNLYGEKPTELDIMFPVEDARVFFPQSYKKYGGGVLRCRGDGVAFFRVDPEDGSVLEGECPGPDACEFARGKRDRIECKAVGNLTFLLPQVTWNGSFQIDTGSKTAIRGINSSIDYYGRLAGRISFVPLKLRRVPREIGYEGKTSTHFIMEIEFPDDPREIERLLKAAANVRKVFDIFRPGGPAGPEKAIATAGPKEIEHELYPSDVVAEHARAGGRTKLPKPPPPPDDDEPAEPPEAEDVETEVVDDACPICGGPLPEEVVVFHGEEVCSIGCANESAGLLDKISTPDERAADAEEVAKAKRRERVAGAIADSGKAGPAPAKKSKPAQPKPRLF
jgi:hypothetical protein